MGKATTREAILEIVKGHLMDNVEDMDEADFDPSRSMKDMGANSLDIVEVVSCTMRDLKVKIPRSELSKLSNVDGLVELLLRVVSEKAQQEAVAS